MLSREQIDFFWEQGYLRIPEVYTPEETDEYAEELNCLMHEWAQYGSGWTGAWRKDYMDAETDKKSRLYDMHDLWLYSAAWMRAVTHPRLVESMTDLIGPDVELHHSTM